MIRKAVICLYLLPLVFLSCNLFGNKGTVLAKVKDRVLTLEDLHIQGITSRDSLMKRVVEWVDQEVLYQEALTQGLQKDPEVAWLLHDAERKILLDAYSQRFEKTFADPEDGELEAYFDRHHEQFLRQEPLVLCRLFQFVSLVEAKDAVKAKLPVSDSSDTLQWKSLSALGSCVAGLVATLHPGQASIPQQCDTKFVVAQLVESKPVGSEQSFEEAREHVRIRVIEERRKQKLDSLLNEAKSRQAVFLWPEHLPPR